MRHHQVYLIAGGRWKNFRRILRAIFAQARLARPAVGYIGVANGERRDFYLSTARDLKAVGAGSIMHIRIGRSGWQNVAAGCEVIFVSGGDVTAGMRVLQRERAVIPLRRLYQQGTIFIGVSAGSIMLSQAWIDWPDEENEAKVRVFPCLGFSPVYCDAHDEPAWAELKALLKQLPAGSRGIGLRSGSAAVVRRRRVEVIAGEIDSFISRRERAKR